MQMQIQELPELSEKSVNSKECPEHQSSLKLEIPLQSIDDSLENVFVDLIEYRKNGVFMIKSVRDFAVLTKTLEKWNEKCSEMIDYNYQQIVDEKRFNFYEGFSDSMSELRIPQFDESQLTTFEKLDFSEIHSEKGSVV